MCYCLTTHLTCGHFLLVISWNTLQWNSHWEDKYQTCDLIAYQLDVKSLMTGVLNRQNENLAFVL
jgi:hypothetical protein